MILFPLIQHIWFASESVQFLGLYPNSFIANLDDINELAPNVFTEYGVRTVSFPIKLAPETARVTS
jgi:hypothetical protein